MKDYPESIYAGESRKKYRELRKESGFEEDILNDLSPMNSDNP